jgi:hypothetical protein
MPKPIENEFNALRARARDRRDKAIAAARSEYEAVLVQIATLEQDLFGKLGSRYRSISQAIQSVIPKDTPFNTADLMAALEALDPGRAWRKRSVDWTLVTLRRKGIVKRIKRATIHEPAVYLMGEAPQVVPLGDMTLIQCIGNVLAGPMNTTEVCVAAVEAGYRTSMSQQNLRNHVHRLLKKNGYKQDGGKWMP